MKIRMPRFLLVILPFLLAACTAIPTGPSVLVLPGNSKNFDQFRADDIRCRHYAFSQIGGATPGQVSTASGIGSVVTGTALGAAAGAAFGGSKGATIGAGGGLIAGSMTGTETAQISGYEAQSRYDMSYIQCKYASGNRVPVSGNLIDNNELDYGYPPYPNPTTTPPTHR